MTNKEIGELKGLAASMGLYDDKDPCKRAVVLGKAIKELEQKPCDKYIKEIDHLRKYICKLETQLVEQQPCEDSISRQAVLDMMQIKMSDKELYMAVYELPPVNPRPKTGHCKDCKYFEYDSMAKVDGVPLIVAHEICSKWGDGCKTSEDGYCFLFESQESEDKE